MKNNIFPENIWELEKKTGTGRLWKYLNKEIQVVWIGLKIFYQNLGLSKASDLAFSTILSLVPILAVIFMMFKLFGGKEIIDSKIKPYFYSFLSPVGDKQLSGYIDSFLNSATVETLGSIGVIFLFVAVYFILSQIERTFNLIWHVKKDRSFFEQIKSYWLIITISPILFILSIALTSYISEIVHFRQSFFEMLFELLIFKLLPFFLIFLFFTIMIISMPNCRVRRRNAIAGALYGTVLYFITKNVFVDYTKLAVSYDIIYGSIAVLPIFMIWTYWFWTVILFIVQLTYVRQNFEQLKLSERIIEVTYFDSIKIALLVSKKMVADYLDSKEPSDVFEYSRELIIPIRDIHYCFSNFEKNGIVKVSEKDFETFFPNIPIKEITVKRVIDSVNKSYVNHNISNNDSKIDKIIDEYKEFKTLYDNTAISDLIS